MAEITEEQLNNAFGVTAAEQEAPAEQEVQAAEEAAEEAEVSQETGTEEAGAEEAEEQTPEQRKANAARRRERERQEAIDKAVKDALDAERAEAAKRQKAFFEKAKLKNSITGEDITNMDQFEEWDRAYSAARVERKLKSGSMTADDLQAMIADNPTVKAAQDILDRQKAEAERAAQAANEAKLQEEIAEIGRVDPTIKSVADLANMPNSKQFYDYVMKGLSFREAYYLSNRERVDAAQLEAARTAAGNRARGKDHLSATATARGAGAMSVPNEQLQMFKLLNPTATPEQIQAYYNKYKR